MPLSEMLWLVLECALIGFGMALGDWAVKFLVVRFLNHGTLHDVDEEEEPTAKQSRRRPRPKRWSGPTTPVGF